MKKVYKPSTGFGECKLHKNSSSDETNNNRKVTIMIATNKAERNNNEQLIQYLKNNIWIYHCILLTVTVVYWLLSFDLFPNLVHPWEHRIFMIFFFCDCNHDESMLSLVRCVSSQCNYIKQKILKQNYQKVTNIITRSQIITTMCFRTCQ